MLSIEKIQNWFDQNGLDSYSAASIEGAETGTVTKQALWDYLGYWRCVYENIVEATKIN
jgi:hypothetical protein